MSQTGVLKQLPITELVDLIEAVATPLFVADVDSNGEVLEIIRNADYKAVEARNPDGHSLPIVACALAAGIRCCARTAAPVEVPEVLPGEEWKHDIQLTPLIGADGIVRRVVGTVTDLTHGSRLVAEKTWAQEAARCKGEYIANMSHEIRTPLNAIIGFAQILVDEVFGPIGEPRYLDYLRDIQFSGKHLLNVINDVLDLSKNDAGRLSLVEQPTEMAEVVDASVRLLRDKAVMAGVVLTVDVPANLPLIWGDEQRLRQVVMNLLSNAIKFTPEGGNVSVKVAAGDAGLTITVTDSGIGIASEDLHKVIQPFGQLESSLTRNREGTGLGLPLSKALLELHGGTLAIRSTPGVGTTVAANLPVDRFVDEEAMSSQSTRSA